MFWDCYYRRREFFAAEILLFLGLPLILMLFFPLVLRLRHLLLAAGLIYVSWFFYSQKFSWQRLGLSGRQFIPALKLILFQAAAAGGAIAFVYLFFRSGLTVPVILAEISGRPAYLTALRYILVSVPLQEIIFRGYLINRMEIAGWNRKQILILSSAIFGLIHAPFNNIYLTLGSAFLGWWWAVSYLKFNNLWAVMISHSLIGLIYILLMA